MTENDLGMYHHPKSQNWKNKWLTANPRKNWAMG